MKKIKVNGRIFETDYEYFIIENATQHSDNSLKWFVWIRCFKTMEEIKIFFHQYIESKNNFIKQHPALNLIPYAHPHSNNVVNYYEAKQGLTTYKIVSLEVLEGHLNRTKSHLYHWAFKFKQDTKNANERENN